MAKIKHRDVGAGVETAEEWMDEDLHELVLDESIDNGMLVVSNPPSGFYKVTNIYCTKVGDTYELIVNHENIPQP